MNTMLSVIFGTVAQIGRPPLTAYTRAGLGGASAAVRQAAR
jgi:hypothetical protein